MKKNRKPMAAACVISATLLVIASFLHPDVSKAEPAGGKMVLAYLIPRESVLGTWFDLIYTEAFRRLGMEFEYRLYPGKRCSMMADRGEVDGEVARVYTYADAHPDLIRVEESHVTVKFLALARDPSIKLNGWESLRGTDYLIAGMRGVKKLREKLPGLVEDHRITLVSDWGQGLKMLNYGRVHLFIDVDFGAPTLLNTDEFKDSGIHVAGVMEASSTYPYLHKKHKALAPELAAVLREMKKEGLIARYRKKAEQR